MDQPGWINRAKFWLVVIGIDIAGAIVFAIVGGVTGAVLVPDVDGNPPMSLGVGLIYLLILIAMVWIGLAAGVKRFHDRNKSVWWVLITLVPLIGGLWYPIECGSLKGTPGSNRFDADPLVA